MADALTLEAYLARVSAVSPLLQAAADTVNVIAEAGVNIAELIAVAPLLGDMGNVLEADIRGDSQKQLDVKTNDIVFAALAAAPVAIVGSEEMEDGQVLDPRKPLAVAIDPLDGSSNIETNASIGTIFAIFPVAGFEHDLPGALLQTGRHQVAAGFLIYGPQVSLIVSFGDGTLLFTFHPAEKRFLLVTERLTVLEDTQEYAINASNYRHWDHAVRSYVDDCLAGESGPHGVNYNTRWVASMVADAYRILIRGGIYLYPGDVRPGYGEGRLRLVYEANPVAMLMEQAGGSATDGMRAILDIEPTTLHRRTPLIFGSRRAVETLGDYYHHPAVKGSRSPLFRNRSVLGG